MRNLSLPLKSELFKKHTPEGILPLLDISWVDDPILGSNQIRIVSNPVDIISNGNTYTRSGFQVVLPDQNPEDIGVLKLAAGNISQEIIATVRQLSVEVLVTLSVVTIFDPDTIEFFLSGTWDFTNYDNQTIQIDVQVFPNLAIEPFPAHRHRFSDGFNILR